MLKKLFPWGGDREKQAQTTLSLESYGITFNESMRAKALYDYPEQVSEAIDEAIEMGEEIKLKAEAGQGDCWKNN